MGNAPPSSRSDVNVTFTASCALAVCRDTERSNIKQLEHIRCHNDLRKPDVLDVCVAGSWTESSPNRR